MKSVRLACVKHAASVRPEPGSNSPIKVYQRFDLAQITFSYSIKLNKTLALNCSVFKDLFLPRRFLALMLWPIFRLFGRSFILSRVAVFSQLVVAGPATPDTSFSLSCPGLPCQSGFSWKFSASGLFLRRRILILPRLFRPGQLVLPGRIRLPGRPCFSCFGPFRRLLYSIISSR
jgi:hypothetical protein